MRGATGLVVGASATACACVLLDVGQPWRAAAVGLFVVLVPGLAWRSRLPVDDTATAWSQAVAVSVASSAVAAELLAITKHWSPTLLVGCLAVASTAVVLYPGRRA